MSNTPTLSDYARRMRTLVEEHNRTAADLRELAKEMREGGLQAVVLKAWVTAIVKADEGDNKPLRRLQAKTQDAAIYAEALGFPVDGFGETKRFVVNELPPHNPDTGEIIEPRPAGPLDLGPFAGRAEELAKREKADA